MSRKFRRSTSFNQCDTSTCTDINGRIRVVHGVEERCNAILNVMRNEWREDQRENYFKRGVWGGMITTYIFSEMQKLPGGESYRYSDITYALRKLEKMGFVKSEMTYDNLHIMWTLVHAPDQVVIRLKSAKKAA